MKRRIVAILVLFTLLITMALPASASMTPYGSEVYVGKLYIVSSMDCESVASLSGHAFIVFENTTNGTLTVGKMAVASGKQVTLGSTDMESVDDRIWYNLEAYSYHTKDEFHQNVYSVLDITLSELLEINDIINGWGKYSLTSNNCVHFAVEVWNVVDYISVSIYSPSNLQNAILAKSNHSTNLELDSQTKIGYYRGTTFYDKY